MPSELPIGMDFSTRVVGIADSPGGHYEGLFQVLMDPNLCSRWSNHIDQLAQGASYDVLRDELHSAQAVEEALRRLLATASVAVTRLNDKFTDVVNKRKFRSLPDDVLAIMFEMACQGLGLRRTIGLTLVSRRFHRILTNLPIIWSKIKSHYSVRKAKALAARATSPTIALNISGAWNTGDDEIARSVGMYKFARSISSRIQTLSLSLEMYDLDEMGEILPSISFPVLVELILKGAPRTGRRSRRHFREWDMPSIRRLNVVDVLPTLRCEVALRIETLTIETNREQDDDEEEVEWWNCSEIVTFIQWFSSVKNLHVTARLFDVYFDTIEALMPSVECLTLHLQDVDTAMKTTVLDIIRFPSLSSFKLVLGLPGLEYLKDVLDGITFYPTIPNSINDLSLSIYGKCSPTVEEPAPEDYRNHFQVIGEWCEKFGELKNLTVESPRLRGLGLFSFAQAMDSLRLVSSEGSTLPLLHRVLREITERWDAEGNMMINRSAVIHVGHGEISAKTIWKVWKLKEMAKFNDLEWSDSSKRLYYTFGMLADYSYSRY